MILPETREGEHERSGQIAQSVEVKNIERREK